MTEVFKSNKFVVGGGGGVVVVDESIADQVEVFFGLRISSIIVSCPPVGSILLSLIKYIFTSLRCKPKNHIQSDSVITNNSGPAKFVRNSRGLL